MGSSYRDREGEGSVDLRVPAPVRWIVRTLEEAGHEAWAVGGAVRDALAGRTSEDWDITTAAPPRRVRKLFPRTVPIGMDHGTVGVLARDGTLYEVTTFRRDVETTGRHAVVEFAERVEEDLARRDFTINAVAWHPLREELNDPFGGRSDLEEGVLRTVGDPRQRFQEDYLRILRALRFAGTFALRVDAATWHALVELAPGIRRLSAERVREELEKVLGGPAPPSRALSLYAGSGCLDVAFRELAGLEASPRVPEGRDGPARAARLDGEDPGDDVWSHALRAVDLIPRLRPRLRLAALLRAAAFPEGGWHADDPAPPDTPLARRGVLRAAAVMERLRFSNAWIRDVGETVEASLHSLPHDLRGATVRRWMHHAGRERLRPSLRLRLAAARADEVRRPGSPDLGGLLELRSRVARESAQDPPLEVRDLAVGGGDLKALGLRPGPHFKEILSHLLEVVLEDPVRNRPEELREVAETYARSRGYLGGDAPAGPRGGRR